MNNRDEMYMLRRKKKILLKDISKSIGVSIPMLSYFERGQRNLLPDNEQKYINFIINYNK